MKNYDEKTHITGRGQTRVNLALSTALIIVAIIIIIPFFRTNIRDTASIPLHGVSGLWADSVFMQMSTQEKISLLLMCRHTPVEFNISDTTAPKGGVLMSFDSLFRYKSFKQIVSRMPAPALSLIDFPDSIPDYPVMMSKLALLSIRSDSLIELYFRHHLAQIRTAGVSMALYPLWETQNYSAQFPDTFLAHRQVSLLKKYNQLSTDNGLIPILPFPGILPGIANPKNYSDSLLQGLLKKIVSPELPAIFIDSMHGRYMPGSGYRQFLKDSFGFYGLIIINKNVRNEKDFFELLATGGDLILSETLQVKVLESITEKYQNDRNSRSLINSAVKRVLLFREWLLNKSAEKKTSGNRSLNETGYLQLFVGLKEASTIILKDSLNLIPFRAGGSTDEYAVHLPINADMEEFTNTLGYFADYSVYRYKAGGILSLDKRRINILIVEDGFKPDNKQLHQHYEEGYRLVTIHIGDIESLKDVSKMPVVIHAWDRHPVTQRHLANSLFGGNIINGYIPFDISNEIRGGAGLPATSRIRLNHTVPEASGISSAIMNRIDSIVAEAIQNGAFPGCQVFIAKDGNVIYHKAFGETTYESGIPVRLTHLYDIASVTKVAATTLAFMKMMEAGKMSFEDPLGKFFKKRTSSLRYSVPDTLIKTDTIIVKGTRRQREKILSAYRYREAVNDTTYKITDTILFTSTRDRNVFLIRTGRLLTHRSGLPPALPISGFINTYNRKTGLNKYREIYSPVMIRDSADIMVAEGMYMYRHYFDTLWERAKMIGVSPSIQYVYSDANMIFLQQAIDTVNKMPLDRYLLKEFYQPLGLRYCMFNPLETFSLDDIIPTANDIRWRRQQIHGTVHDPTAALFGGVAGNAGLFANAHDLGILGQMLLDSGSYGGRRFLDPSTISQFTTKQKESHRGLGFEIPSSGHGLIAASAPAGTYGHSGFTGTCLWIDPQNRIVYVFLSNRVYPNTENQKINIFRVRERVHQVIYDAMDASRINRVR